MALGIETNKLGKGEQLRISAALENLRWRRDKRQAGTGRQLWVKV